MGSIIKTLEIACGKGKTHRYAVKRMLAETEHQFLYVAPTLELIDEVEEAVVPKRRGRPSILAKASAAATFARADSSQQYAVNRQLRECLVLSLDSMKFTSRIVAITHNSLPLLTADMVRDRIVIIDEMPQWLAFYRDSAALTWDSMLAEGFAEQQTTMPALMTVLPKGAKLIAASKPHGWRAFRAYTELLKCLSRGIATRVADDCVRVALAPVIATEAKEVVLMTANLASGFFPEWGKLNGILHEPVDASGYALQEADFACPNALVYYVSDRANFTSKDWLRGVLDELRNVARTAADLWPNYLAAINKQHKRYVGADLAPTRVVPVNVRGVNRHRDCDTMLWLGATRPSRADVNDARAISGRTWRDIDAAQHMEACLQFVMRGRLREDNNANVRIVVPTRGDAEYLVRLLKARPATPFKDLVKQNGTA